MYAFLAMARTKMGSWSIIQLRVHSNLHFMYTPDPIDCSPMSVKSMPDSAEADVPFQVVMQNPMTSCYRGQRSISSV